MNKNIKAGADIHAGDGGYKEGTWEEYDEFVKVRNQSLCKARIRQFEKESDLEIFGLGARRDKWETAMEKFAELIIDDAVSVLRQEWYQLNNSEYNQTDPRSVGFHVGMKSGVNKSMVLIRKHFGVSD